MITLIRSLSKNIHKLLRKALSLAHVQTLKEFCLHRSILRDWMQRGSGISMRRSGHFAPAFLQLTLPAQSHYSQSQMQAHWNWPQVLLQVLSCELVQSAVHADVKETQRGHVWKSNWHSLCMQFCIIKVTGIVIDSWNTLYKALYWFNMNMHISIWICKLVYKPLHLNSICKFSQNDAHRMLFFGP